MMPRYLSQSIQLSGLEQKEWFHKWRKSVFTICAVIPLLMSVISDHFGFFNVQGLLILGGLLICLVLSLTPSLNIFKKDGDSKKMLVFRALTMSIGFVVLMGFMVLIALFVIPFTSNLLINYI